MVDTFNGPIIGPVVVQGSAQWWDEQNIKHRAPGRERNLFGFYDKERRIALRATNSTTDSSRVTPRHKHTFDQVRYTLRGATKLGREIYGAGVCLYQPEGVPYGPEDASVSDERVAVGMQFSGPSGIPHPHPKDLERARRELAQIGTFKGGIFSWPDGRKQDGHEACMVHITGRELVFPAPRYSDIVAMHTENYSWQTLDGGTGVLVKHLGYFNEAGPNIKMIKLDAGGSTPAGLAPCQQVRFVIEGEITYEGEHYTAVSCMYFPAHVPYSSTSSSTGATLFVVQLASPDGDPPPFCLI
jgi:hypothetical protein